MFKNGVIFTIMIALTCLAVYLNMQIDKEHTRRLSGVPALERRVVVLERQVQELQGVNSVMLALMSNCVSVVRAQQENMSDTSSLCSNVLRAVEIHVFGDLK